MENTLFLNFDQIIPVKDAEELVIKMAQKQKEEISAQTELKHRHIIRKEFWEKLIRAMNEQNDLFQNISPSIYNWIGAGSGIRGLGYNFSVAKTYGRPELYIDRGDQEENKFCFDYLLERKEEIEREFGDALTWERLNEKRACRIKYEMPANVFNREDWDEMIEFMVDGMLRLERAFKKPLKDLNKVLKNK